LMIIAVGGRGEIIHIKDMKDSTRYYRDSEDRHVVPKRVLEDILLSVYE